VIGGGQLARMMAGPAIELGLHLRLLATDPQESAAQVIPDVLLGRHDDPSAVQELARDVDVVTFDHEHVPQEVLATLGDLAPARPGPAALTHAQDKLTMRRRLTELGHPCPRWWEVADAGALDEAIAAAGGRAVVKTPRGGYDGHGVRIVEKAEQVADWCTGHESLLVEELVPFTRELSAQVARTPSGEIATYPVVRSTQKDGVCFEVLAPAPDLDAEAQERIQGLARAIAEDLGVTGMLAVELFELADGRVLVNELAMRPHNTGHWSMDGAVTGQFEQHLRAVADLPLGSTASHAPYAVMVNLLGGSRVDLAPGVAEALRRDPALKVHLYGKGVRPGRKLGHVTVIGEDPDDLLARAHRAERLIIEGSDSTEGTDSTDGVTNA
jgi:5-(carboxyamino)imidazole ribonucleotide synthase